MFPYLLHVILTFLVFLAFCMKYERNPRLYIRIFNLTYIFLTLIAVFRYGVGMDTPSYMSVFEYIPSIKDLRISDFALFRFQPLFLLICSLSKSIYNDFFILQIFQCTIFFGGIYFAMRELKIRRFYLLIIFFLSTYIVSGLSAMRESFSIGFGLFSYLAFIKGRKKTFFLLLLASYGCHSAGMIFCVPPLLSKVITKNHFRTLVLFILTSFAVFFLIEQIQSIIGKYVADNAVSRYSNFEAKEFNLVNLTKNIAQIFFLYFFIIRKTISPKELVLSYLALSYIILDILTSTYMGVLYRFSSYLIVFYLWAIFRIFTTNFSKKYMPIFTLGFFVFYYQPIARYIHLFSYREGKAALEYYCFVFSDNKTYYNKQIENAYIKDYFFGRI